MIPADPKLFASKMNKQANEMAHLLGVTREWFDNDLLPHLEALRQGWEERLIMECPWTYDDIDDYWETACGEQFMFTEGTPTENKMKFCPYCGKLLKEVTNEADK